MLIVCSVYLVSHLYKCVECRKLADVAVRRQSKCSITSEVARQVAFAVDKEIPQS